MGREITLMILGLIAGCGGFAVPPTARRLRPKAARGCWRRPPRNGCHASTSSRSSSAARIEMSIREMIGADVESGGLFDPLGEKGWTDCCVTKRRCFSGWEQDLLLYSSSNVRAEGDKQRDILPAYLPLSRHCCRWEVPEPKSRSVYNIPQPS